MYSPKIAATSILVHNGRRKMYERMRVGLNCAKDAMADRVGIVVGVRTVCLRASTRDQTKDEMTVYQATGIPRLH